MDEELLREALRQGQRAVVVLHKYENLGYEQIVWILGRSLQAVKSVMFRAHETLRARLGVP